ncbi:MAG: outer membrane beta-barrel protein [Treponema sp.]|nr:outer membrane beta-barrel protein [Treponema sp.]
MKKILAVVMAFAVSAVSAFAVDAALGVRGDVSMNLGSSVADDVKIDGNSSQLVWGGGFSLYGVIDFYSTDQFAVGVQPELGIQFNNGVKQKKNGLTQTITNNTFEIPVFLTMKYNVTPNLYFGGGIGPYVSFQMGKLKAKGEYSNTTTTTDYSSKGAAFGLAFDFKSGVKAGSGFFVFDVRYLLNFNPTKVEINDKSKDVFTRRALTFGIGYEVKF